MTNGEVAKHRWGAHARARVLPKILNLRGIYPLLLYETLVGFRVFQAGLIALGPPDGDDVFDDVFQPDALARRG